MVLVDFRILTIHASGLSFNTITLRRYGRTMPTWVATSSTGKVCGMVGRAKYF